MLITAAGNRHLLCYKGGHYCWLASTTSCSTIGQSACPFKCSALGCPEDRATTSRVPPYEADRDPRCAELRQDLKLIPQYEILRIVSQRAALHSRCVDRSVGSWSAHWLKAQTVPQHFSPRLVRGLLLSGANYTFYKCPLDPHGVHDQRSANRSTYSTRHGSLMLFR
jgi:hypothetical protein